MLCVCDVRCGKFVVKVCSEYELEDLDVFKASSALVRVTIKNPSGPDSAEPDLTLRNTFSFDT